MLREPRLVIRQVIVTKLNVINGSFPPNSLLQSASGRVPQPDSRIAGSRCQPIKINCYACCRVSTRAQQSIARDLVHPSFPQSSHDPKRATKFSLPRCAVTTGSLSLQIWSAGVQQVRKNWSWQKLILAYTKINCRPTTARVCHKAPNIYFVTLVSCGGVYQYALFTLHIHKLHKWSGRFAIAGSIVQKDWRQQPVVGDHVWADSIRTPHYQIKISHKTISFAPFSSFISQITNFPTIFQIFFFLASCFPDLENGKSCWIGYRRDENYKDFRGNGHRPKW